MSGEAAARESSIRGIGVRFPEIRRACAPAALGSSKVRAIERPPTVKRALAQLSRRRHRATVAGLLWLAPWASAWAQNAPAADSPASEAQVNAADVTPPVLRTQHSAIYPEAARRERVESKVGLELTIDERGEVTDVKVVAPAGRGFDEAATEAARGFKFEPARRAGVAVRSKIHLTYEFQLPPEPPPVVAPAPSAVPTSSLPAAAGTTTPQASSKAAVTPASEPTVLVLGSRPISAASSFSVRDRDFQLRPIGSVQDILRVTPGLVLVQHSGGGKANQYFMRGFDADHGTDLALSLDGVPINLVSHAHGQGFSDTNFIIPEVVERVEVSKGPYFANQGDFATAGAVNMVSRNAFEHSSVGFGLTGSPGHGSLGYRGLLIASPKLDKAKATFAVDVGRSNGPFENPERWDRFKLFNKLTLPLGSNAQLRVGELSYGANWYGSGQIPARAVEQGLISRFGSFDRDEGGNTARHQLFAQYRARVNDHSELKALAYLGSYRFNLFSNFTLFLSDPERGDEIEQVDRRVFYGGRLSYRSVRTLGGIKLDTTLGGDGRSDDIHEELWHTARRERLDAVRKNAVNETFVGAFINEEVTPVRWLRVNLGGRADLLSFAVGDKLGSPDPTAPHSGVDAAHQLSPKASLIVTPLQTDGAEVDVYANYGHGFHSNDVRGVFASPAVSPLTRAIGSELGARARLFRRWDLAAALWRLDLANETVWIGDEGTTEVAGATTRRGLEVETRYELTDWLAADLDLTFTKSAFRENAGNGDGLALAPKQTWSGGVSARHALGPGVARAGLRFYGIGERPASDDGALVATGFTQIDLHAGYRHRWFDVALDIENLLDATFRAAQFDTVSRLPNEPAIGAAVPAGFSCGRRGRLPAGSDAGGGFNGCEDVNYTPAYPLTMRVMATVFLD
jgi:TonB family protein